MLDWTGMNLPVEASVLRFARFSFEDYQLRFADRHRLHDVVKHWAQEREEQPALIAADGSRTLTWSQFERATAALAIKLLARGFERGDYLVTQLPMSVDHVLLEYACFRIGVVVAPLDLRLSAAEVMRAVEILRPRVFAGVGVRPPFDFRSLWSALQQACPFVPQWLAVDSTEPLEGADSYAEFAECVERALAGEAIGTAEERTRLEAIDKTVREDDGALVIFTTGSTGSPKPALLSHKNITVQNMCLCGAFFGGDSGRRSLVNLPPSHVGGQTELLMSTLFGGGAAVLMDLFDAARSMRAISAQQVEILGQIPVMFNLEWMLRDYAQYDVSSLKFAAYGGNAVARPFVERLAAMAPVVGTGLGLTEAAGFCTYVEADAQEHELILAGLGVDMPIYPCTIRQPMREDGEAGDELPEGEVGHVCFNGPQTFLGYVNDAEATARTISRDGYLYTGDLGRMDAKGLHLTGRAKWVIKSMGYQVFPGDVEEHVCALADKVTACVAVGAEHAVLSEAVVAVVEKRPDAELNARELDRHARTLAPYMRPRHWIVLEPGQMPLNRVGKPDHMRMQQMAREAIVELRQQGAWDSGLQPGER
jgi:acyl-CoA synthetase (AMP-forming)/AMP-acid ligase II